MITKEVLVLENNKQLSHLICTTLKEKGEFNVHQADSINTAERILKQKHIDLITIDVGLDDGNGLDLLKRVKENPKFINIKGIVITQFTKLEDRVRSFELGADDYIAKPFYPEELLIRVRKVLGMIKPKPHAVNYKDLEICTDEGCLVYEGRVHVKLTPLETNIMLFLADFKQTATNEKLMKFLESKIHKKLSKAALTVAINRLRNKFEQAIGMGLIKSSYGKGYYIGI